MSLFPEIEARPTDRLFFAVFPDADTAQRIARLAADVRTRHGLHGKPLQTERFHVTLHFLGDYAGVPGSVVAAAESAAVAMSAMPFEIVFDRVASFAGRPRQQPLVLQGDSGLDALSGFRASLGLALAAAGLGRHVDPRYTPHLTLLYDDTRVAMEAIEPITWTAREFVLVHSELGRTRHVPLGRWPLTAARPRSATLRS